MNIKDSIILTTYVDTKISTMQHTLLQAIAAMGQKPTIRVNATMDEATYSTIMKSGNNYVLVYSTDYYDPPDLAGVGGSGVIAEIGTPQTIDASGNYIISIDRYCPVVVSGCYYKIDAGAWVTVDYSTQTTWATFTTAPVALTVGNVIHFGSVSQNTTAGREHTRNRNILKQFTTDFGTIKSNAIASDANLIRYFEKLKLNLDKGTSTHATPLQLKIFGNADAYAAPLNTNWVTIPESEYAELLLERRIEKTATSNTQTTWDFTSLTNIDALINEIGCQYVLLVEQANDGSTYSILTENVDYYVDLTVRTAPRITLVSGTGIVDTVSKLRATMIVNILDIDEATKNTAIKVQIQENRTDSSETSPAIQPLPVATTQYVSVDYIARY